jgi:PAS domain S-box-containing protein
MPENFLGVHHTRSIRTNLLGLVTACLLPVLVSSAIVLIYHYQNQRDQLASEILSDVRTLRNVVDRELAAVQTTIDVLATSPYLQNNELADFHDRAIKVLTVRNNITNVALVTRGGQQLLNTAQPFGQPLPTIELAAQVERIFSTGQPEAIAVTGGPLVSLAVPVRVKQKVAFVLLGFVPASLLQELISNSPQTRDRITAIFDKSAIVAARSRTPEIFVGKSVAPDLLARLKVENEGTQELVTLDGIRVFSAFSRSRTTGWGAVIGIPMQALTADLRRSTGQLVTATAALLGLGLWMAWLMGGRIARTMEKLIEPARDLVHGRAVSVSGLSFKEAEILGNTLVHTSAVLQSSTDALKSSEIRIRSILQSAMDAIIILDDKKMVMLFNSAACSMFDCSVDEAVGQPIAQFIAERFLAPHFTSAENTGVASRRSAGSERYEIASVPFGLRKNGEEFQVEFSYSKVQGSDGIFYTLIVHDITDRVKAYKALERSNLDLQQFAYVASHDLKTPLRSINGYMQILERKYSDKLDESAQALIQRSAKAASHLEQLVEDMLSFVRVGSQPRPFAPVDCFEVVNEAIDMLDAQIQSTAATVSVGDLPIVMGERTQLFQLFLNLLGNGMKYCKAHPPVMQISARRDGSDWVFSVEDNGIGIEASQHQKIFEIFKRLHSQNEYAGTGIGLAVCHKIVERHGGKIWVQSAVGHGSIFYFTLPYRL